MITIQKHGLFALKRLYEIFRFVHYLWVFSFGFLFEKRIRYEEVPNLIQYVPNLMEYKPGVRHEMLKNNVISESKVIYQVSKRDQFGFSKICST